MNVEVKVDDISKVSYELNVKADLIFQYIFLGERPFRQEKNSKWGDNI